VHHVTKILETHPQATANETLARCIEQCFACALTCTSCADACLAEERVQELVRCIRLDLDCADMCEATGRLLTRQTSSVPQLTQNMLGVCAQACRTCAEECERHAQHHEHCRVCAEVCRRCEQACEDLLSSLGA
jgi:uncharacterized protein DUF326